MRYVFCTLLLNLGIDACQKSGGFIFFLLKEVAGKLMFVDLSDMPPCLHEFHF